MSMCNIDWPYAIIVLAVLAYWFVKGGPVFSNAWRISFERYDEFELKKTTIYNLRSPLFTPTHRRMCRRWVAPLVPPLPLPAPSLPTHRRRWRRWAAPPVPPLPLPAPSTPYSPSQVSAMSGPTVPPLPLPAPLPLLTVTGGGDEGSDPRR